jgi:hypothetical protein
MGNNTTNQEKHFLKGINYTKPYSLDKAYKKKAVP